METRQIIPQLTIKNEWCKPGDFSRFQTWNYAKTQIGNWLKQKGYADYKKPYGVVNLCQKFAKKYNFNGSATDTLILAYQNFKLFRDFVNELKIKTLTTNGKR